MKKNDSIDKSRRVVIKSLAVGATGITFAKLVPAQAAGEKTIPAVVNLLMDDTKVCAALGEPLTLGPTSPNAAQNVCIPEGAIRAVVSLNGAGGGSANAAGSSLAFSSAPGGNGGNVIGSLDVSGIDELIVHVGEGGKPDGTPGEFGGGAGGTTPFDDMTTFGSVAGGGGGGYAAVFDSNDTVLALAGGGGGGGGGNDAQSSIGGAGGTATNNNEEGDGSNGQGLYSYLGGTFGNGANTTGGAGANGGGDGTGGSLLQGGTGGSNLITTVNKGGAGGGGGGGLTGGAGGGAGGGGEGDDGGGGGGGGGGLQVLPSVATSDTSGGGQGGTGALEGSSGNAGQAGSVQITFYDSAP
ncbi:hypothetical protein [Arenicella xantha]|uniref:Glycine rich protein n=1 Tax=Arenicella xantha TaxID=644221 RepID=A0A395JK51_9GAMM|nr:hypothetical protein [Arenicella xantha]RBP51061.1 hypothetical protein DFR28_102480 [Arenicella xantha]